MQSATPGPGAAGQTSAPADASASRATATQRPEQREQFVCRGCSRQEEAKARETWAKLRPRAERHLAELRPEERLVRIVLINNVGAWEARIALTLASATLTAHAEDVELETAISEAVIRLRAVIARHRAWLHMNDARRRRRRRRSDLRDVTASLAADRQRDDQGAFVETLRPYLPQLRHLARHEIQAAQLEGRIYPGAITVGDLVDELLVRAWQRFDQRPEDQPLDSWLVGLLFEVADDLLRSGAAPTDAGPPISTQDARLAVADGWVTTDGTVGPAARDLTIEDLLADRSVEANPDAYVDSAELTRLVAEALQGLPQEQRRAFVLAAFDGWTEEEIAMLQRRSPEAVRADEASVRTRLRQLLAERGWIDGGERAAASRGSESGPPAR